MGSYNRIKGNIYTKKEESVSIVKRGERRGMQVHWRTTKKGYIRLLKPLQIVLVFFVKKKDGKKYMV